MADSQLLARAYHALRVQKDLVASGLPIWIHPDTDHISAMTPFSSIPTHYRISVEGVQRGFVQAGRALHYTELARQLGLASEEARRVVDGRLRIQFGDGHRDISPGEFIIVPRGLEHCPLTLTDEVQVVLLAPKSHVNTGNVRNERTVTQEGRI